MLKSEDDRIGTEFVRFDKCREDVSENLWLLNENVDCSTDGDVRYELNQYWANMFDN